MMGSIQIYFLAIVQGITELIPVSSTGHVLLASKYIFNGQPDILLLTVLQFGTTISILIAFKDFLFTDFFNRNKWKLYINIAIASLPAIVGALLLQNIIEEKLYTSLVIALSLLVWGIFMIIVEKYHPKPVTTEITNVTFTQSLLVGFAQALAIIPGTSRSGSTTVIGILSGIEKYTALRFSFLLGLPVLIGSFFYELYKYRDNLSSVFSPDYVIGMIIAGVVGFIAIQVLSRYSKKNFLQFFGIYRIILAIIILFTLIH